MKNFYKLHFDSFLSVLDGSINFKPYFFTVEQNTYNRCMNVQPSL